MIRTTAQGFLGLSVHCARCHDHKFDPITRMDYYRMMAMFFPAVYYDWQLAAPDKIAEYEANKSKLDAEINSLKDRIKQIEAPYYKTLFEKKLATFPADIQAALKKPASERTLSEEMIAKGVLAGRKQIVAFEGLRSNQLSPEDRELKKKLQAQIAQLEKKLPPLPQVEGIRDGDYRFTPPGFGDEPAPGKGSGIEYSIEGKLIPEPGDMYKPPPVHFGANGSPDDDKWPVVLPGFLTVLSNGNEVAARPPSNGHITTGRRRALAEWIASENNPLTARVMVNRIWLHHFGQGIVNTPSNFGKMGSRPSHPDLLDWLATEFMRGGWSIKRMQRLIMGSQAYQMTSSFYDATALEKDPSEVYLWRFPLKRLEAEIIRDVILSASGKLERLEAGGPPFFPTRSGAEVGF